MLGQLGPPPPVASRLPQDVPPPPPGARPGPGAVQERGSVPSTDLRHCSSADGGGSHRDASTTAFASEAAVPSARPPVQPDHEDIPVRQPPNISLNPTANSNVVSQRSGTEIPASSASANTSAGINASAHRPAPFPMPPVAMPPPSTPPVTAPAPPPTSPGHSQGHNVTAAAVHPPHRYSPGEDEGEKEAGEALRCAGTASTFASAAGAGTGTGTCTDTGAGTPQTTPHPHAQNHTQSHSHNCQGAPCAAQSQSNPLQSPLATPVPRAADWLGAEPRPPTPPRPSRKGSPNPARKDESATGGEGVGPEPAPWQEQGRGRGQSSARPAAPPEFISRLHSGSDVSAKEGLRQRSKSAAPSSQHQHFSDEWAASEARRVSRLSSNEVCPRAVTGLHSLEEQSKRVKELLLLFHPDKRRPGVEELAGGKRVCDAACDNVMKAKDLLSQGLAQPQSAGAGPPHRGHRPPPPAPPPGPGPRRSNINSQPPPPPAPPPTSGPPPAPPPPLEEKPDTLPPMDSPALGCSARILVECD